MASLYHVALVSHSQAGGSATEKFPPAERRYLKEQFDTQGAAPVLAALAALCPPTAEATDAIADAQTYFTRNAARMDYPQFVARQFPIGSGAVESACKGLVEARLKQAGMRWGVPGSQAIASLRALPLNHVPGVAAMKSLTLGGTSRAGRSQPRARLRAFLLAS